MLILCIVTYCGRKILKNTNASEILKIPSILFRCSGSIFYSVMSSTMVKMKAVQHETEKLGDCFEPSMKLLTRIMRVILEKNSVKKTGLSLEANIQYARLLKHLEWLEKKSLIESVVERGKVNVKLTRQGREFTMLISPV